MSDVRGTSLGKFMCACGCGCDVQEMTVANETYMTCTNCSCNQARLDARLKIRVYVHGALNVHAMQAMLSLAQELGVEDNSELMTENVHSHYVEVPADGIHARLEIAKITGK